MGWLNIYRLLPVEQKEYSNMNKKITSLFCQRLVVDGLGSLTLLILFVLSVLYGLFSRTQTQVN